MSMQTVGMRQAITQQREKRLASSYLAPKIGYISINKTHTQRGAGNSLFQFCLTITKLFSSFYLEETKNY